MIYGTPVIHVEDDQTDRIGIRTLVLSQLWQASAWPLSQLEMDAETPATPAVPGGLYFIGRQTRSQRGFLRTTWTFEGINGDGKSVTFKDRSNSLDYQFDGAFAEASILKHPEWPALRDNFGATVLDGQVTWQDTVPKKTGGSGLAGGNKYAGQPNPIFGYDTYFRTEGTYSFRYASTTQIVLTGTNYLTSQLPGNPPAVGDGRNWLKAPMKSIRRGPVFDITEIYWLSGPGGWPPQIYTPNGANGGGGGASGLTTGDLTTGSLGTEAAFNAVFGTPLPAGYYGPPAPPTG